MEMVAKTFKVSHFHGLAIALALMLGACGHSFTSVEIHQAYDAAAKGDGAAMRAALDHGFDPNYYYWDRGYLIENAVMAPKTDALVVLIKSGARVNVQNPDDSSTPLIEAVSTDHCESARILLEAGARKDSRFTNAGAVAAAELDGMTAPQIYQMYRTKYPKSYNSKCWSEVGRMLLAPADSSLK